MPNLDYLYDFLEEEKLLNKSQTQIYQYKNTKIKDHDTIKVHEDRR